MSMLNFSSSDFKLDEIKPYFRATQVNSNIANHIKILMYLAFKHPSWRAESWISQFASVYGSTVSCVIMSAPDCTAEDQARVRALLFRSSVTPIAAASASASAIRATGGPEVSIQVASRADNAFAFAASLAAPSGALEVPLYDLSEEIVSQLKEKIVSYDKIIPLFLSEELGEYNKIEKYGTYLALIIKASDVCSVDYADRIKLVLFLFHQGANFQFMDAPQKEELTNLVRVKFPFCYVFLCSSIFPLRFDRSKLCEAIPEELTFD
jgi:hypothetical protein